MSATVTRLHVQTPVAGFMHCEKRSDSWCCKSLLRPGGMRNGMRLGTRAAFRLPLPLAFEIPSWVYERVAWQQRARELLDAAGPSLRRASGP